MHHRKLKLGVAAAGAAGIALTLAVPPAFADYAPSSKDFVGVGSDTVQYAADFAADDDYIGDPGFNVGKANKDINFDATPDANARLAYASLGAGQNVSGTLECAPGTGASAHTGNGSGLHADSPCTLNPTIVLRAGAKPVQRPNGSGGGANAILTDPSKLIGYSRASSKQGSTLGSTFDSITLGTDDLKMLVSTTPATHAVALSEAQMQAIYKCDDGTASHAPVTWNEVGGSSSDAIIPLVPQVGSGTRKTFLADIGVSTVGACVQTVEENDPTAIAATSNPADAIEPMSSGRLNMFQGLIASLTPGSTSSSGVGGYFQDPSCTSNAINAAAAAAVNNGAANPPTDPCFPGKHLAANGGNPAVTYPPNDTLSPAVAYVTGTPATGTANLNPPCTGTCTLLNSLYTDTRNLYIYFRDADVNSSTPAEPGGATGDNWVRTLFYDPCPDASPTGTDGCTTDPVAGVVGPFGVPWFASASGQSDIEASGITPAYTPNLGGP